MGRKRPHGGGGGVVSLLSDVVCLMTKCELTHMLLLRAEVSKWKML